MEPIPFTGVAAGRDMPRLSAWDSTVSWRRDPYRFVSTQCRALETPAVRGRLLLQPAIFMTGADSAALFYDEHRFARAGAAPEPLRATLFGEGAVQGLDGDRHRRRKALFLTATAPGEVSRLINLVREEWQRALPDWAARGPISLYEAMHPVLVHAVCAWAGIPLPDADTARRTQQLVALFDWAARGPLAHLRARIARREAEQWLVGLIDAARALRLRLPDASAASLVAWHSDVDGTMLPAQTAAVELINLLRPVVAVSVYIACTAHALWRHPQWRSTLAERPTGREALAFVHEVRRYYPFFPMVAARVRHDFSWHGLRFPAGTRTLLDLYGTNHDPAVWPRADDFWPERWLSMRPGRYDFVAQGGGDVARQHRCPGEDVTVQLMLLALEMLLRQMQYDVPADAPLMMRRLPAIPRGGFVIDGVRLAGSIV